jgi:predicted nucleotidyltransferase
MKSDAQQIISVIADEFRPRRVYQWGSLLDRRHYRSYSDIDIAVEGITDVKVWTQLEARVWDMTDYPLDLVRLERIEPEYAEIIRNKGIIVYERSN